mgnify:CR=1 FL=1
MSLPAANEFVGALMLLGGIFVTLLVIGFVMQFWPLILIGLIVLAIIKVAAK